MCGVGVGGRSEHWSAGMMETVWMWPCTAMLCSMTLLTLVRFGVCVCVCGGGGVGQNIGEQGG